MDVNALFLGVALFVATMDVLFATFVLPRALSKNPNTKPQAIRMVRLACYMSAAIIAVLGFIVYHLHLI